MAVISSQTLIWLRKEAEGLERDIAAADEQYTHLQDQAATVMRDRDRTAERLRDVLLLLNIAPRA